MAGPLVSGSRRAGDNHQPRLRSGGRRRNDEALELEQKLPDVPHVQNPDRVAAARVAIEEFECQLILLDDAFQHRRIHRDSTSCCSMRWSHLDSAMFFRAECFASRCRVCDGLTWWPSRGPIWSMRLSAAGFNQSSAATLPPRCGSSATMCRASCDRQAARERRSPRSPIARSPPSAASAIRPDFGGHSNNAVSR